MYNQFNKYKPHRNIIIQFNRGYKSCYKNLKYQSTTFDLCDAYYTVFKNAQELNYKNILVLEDDFIFDEEEFMNRNNIRDIELFVTNTNYDVLNLGSTIYMQYLSMYQPKFMKCIFTLASTGVLYNINFMNTYITLYENNKVDKDFDQYFTTYYFNCYVYYKPLIFQPILETPNSRNWSMFGIKFSKFIFKLMPSLGFNFNNYIEIKKSFNRLKFLSETVTNIIYLVIFFLIIFLFKNFN